MSYVQQTLAGDEEIILRARFNWTYSFWHVFFFILGFAPVAVFAWGQFAMGRSFEELQLGYYVSFFAVFLGCLILLLHMIHLWTTEIAITTYRFIFKTGLISRDTKEVSLGNIEEINLQQSIWGRVFGYGSMILRGTGVGVIELPNIDNPINVRKTMEDARANRRKGASTQSAMQETPAQTAAAEPAQRIEPAPIAPPAGGQAPVQAPAGATAPAKNPGLFGVLKASAAKEKARKDAKRKK
ncbi:PH domain-containing protein [Parvularcula sp. IMCC14364]|uniref:PH domain-containing protein n=1 Tax=Parvularcula sp. IMCC14364 TaxID=3067902 RepID=UPI0027406DC7|nr:PH domain-containing protein [Parvularcula sp. IMCC14364]